MVVKTVEKRDLKYPEVLNDFLILLKEYGFEYIHDPLNGDVYVKGDISYISLDPHGTAEISLVNDNKYLKVEINTDNITVGLVRSDPDSGLKIKELVLRKNVRVYSYTDFGYLTIEY
jgi:hypothetical protein